MPAIQSERTLRVSEYLTICSTRESGKKFYPILREWVDRDVGSVRISFEGVEFVSPSFLDEAIVRLIEEQPQLAERLTIVSLKPMASRRLKARLENQQVGAPVLA